MPAVLQLNPVVVAAGTTTRVTGASFPAGEVTLAWVFADGTTVPAGTLTVPDERALRRPTCWCWRTPRRGRASSSRARATAAASDQALVVAGTTQPGRNGLVNRR